MGVDRGGAQREPIGDLLDAQALREQFEDFALAGGQLEQLLDLPGTLAELGADERAGPPSTTSIARAMSSLGG